MLKFCVPMPLEISNFTKYPNHPGLYINFQENLINPNAQGARVLVNLHDVYGGMLAINVLGINGDIADVSYSSPDLYGGPPKHLVWQVLSSAIKRIEVPGG